MSDTFVDEVLSGTSGAAPPTPGQTNAPMDDDLGGVSHDTEAQWSYGESAGDAPTMLGPAKIVTSVEAAPADAHEEAGPDSSEAGEEYLEATPEQLAAAAGPEAGEESAVSDLRAEGFQGLMTAAAPSPLREAGMSAAAPEQEFAFLAALVPALISSVGPALAKAVTARLSPQSRSAIKRIAKQVPAIGLPKPKGGPVGLTGLLPMVAKLFEAAEAGSGGEAAAGEAVNEAVVAEAAAAMETIIGVDQRIRINNTSAIPWRRYCALRITFPSGATYRGTGFFIGRRAVATAGHCVYLRNQGGWARRIEVIPGCNGTSRPFGSAVATEFRSTGGWVSTSLPEADYGCIFLPNGAFNGANLGYFGAAAFDASVLLAQPAVLAGYPGDKPFAELWGMAQVIKIVSAKTLGYQIDTYAGQSGAPLYIKRNGIRYVVGIHNYGAATGNSATRVTEPVYRRLAAWAKA